MGYNVLQSTTTGNFNAAMGSSALLTNTTGVANIAVGASALASNTTGGSNTALGTATLVTNTTGSNNTALGAGADVGASTLTYATAIGAGTIVTTSATIQLGTTGLVAAVQGAVPYTVFSDGRFKIDVKEAVPGLEFITRLRPVTYRFDMDKMAEFLHTPEQARSFENELKVGQIVKTGFIAQEVEQVANELSYDFDGVNKSEDENGTYTLAYSTFVVPLVKAVQEQQSMIQDQQALIDQLRKEVEELKAALH